MSLLRTSSRYFPIVSPRHTSRVCHHAVQYSKCRSFPLSRSYSIGLDEERLRPTVSERKKTRARKAKVESDRILELVKKDPMTLPEHSSWRQIFYVSQNDRVAIANPQSAQLVAEHFIPKEETGKVIIEAFPGPGQLTRALLKLPKERVEKIIVLEDNARYLDYLKPLEDVDSRVKIVPLSGLEWGTYDTIQEMGLLENVKELEWDAGVHPQLQFVSHMPINVYGEQLMSQFLRLVPDRQWLFKYGRVKMNLLLSDYVWQRVTAIPGDKAYRCKLSVIADAAVECKSLLYDELQPFRDHFHPVLYRQPTSEATAGNRKVGNPMRTVSVVPREEQIIQSGSLDVWDYCLRRLFVQKATAVGRSIPSLGPGAQSLLTHLEKDVDLNKPVRALELKDWESIVRVFSEWPFAPSVRIISSNLN
ncbi:S-adenosyl-L-methionine-dependent methyltransferase [Dendrothele bispora CBS 962.96]|uniref:rRNA adenine N(6)-methyltransferase n=1 Tax=Dendrothele bispora (strain CBS 962.96) TaxID=1314807 RepID=A0A4S8MQK6_DENBC|nr:S-adenosyl-L-methionine-dependent methyltransferase [Dendrothele bispora CBS 962.96]